MAEGMLALGDAAKKETWGYHYRKLLNARENGSLPNVDPTRRLADLKAV